MRKSGLLLVLCASCWAMCAIGAGASVGLGLAGAVSECLQPAGSGDVGALQGNADTVDWFHASGTPKANTLLALDGAKHFPVSVIPDNSIPGGKLAYGAVTAGRLRDGAVTTGKLAFGAVTAGRLANDSVTSRKITNHAIRGEDVGIPLLMGGSRNGYLIGCFNSNTGDSTSGITGYSTATTGNTRGVVGACKSPTGKGVYGVATSSTGWNYGVYGTSNSSSGRGVYGYASAASGTTYGVAGETDSESGCGVWGRNGSGNYGSLGGPGRAVYGVNANCNYGFIGGDTSGVWGECYTTDGVGVVGRCDMGSNSKGVWGYSANGLAGLFGGKVEVTGRFDCPDKHFKIDHPQDPQNMYLHHACVESSERKNVYDGTVVLDARGEAWVELPDWFEALNCDFRYQLTPIGAPGPNLYIARKIQDGCFGIAGGQPGMEVSWQVTGRRQDPYALAHPFEVEVEKPDVERGYYMHPELYGMPDTTRVEWATSPDVMTDLRGTR